MNFNFNERQTISSLLVFHIILILSTKIKCMDIASDFMDLKQPIVILDKRQENNNNYFSYSIAAFGSVSQNSFMQSRLYFGSPKSNYSSGSSFESGEVMKCGLKFGEFSESIQCKTLPLSSSGAPANSYPTCCERYGFNRWSCDIVKELPDEAWVGGTLSTSSVSGNQLVTCGHRWQTEDSFYVPKHRRVSGVCYRLRVSDMQFPEGNRLTPEILRPPLNALDQFYPTRGFNYPLWTSGKLGFSSAFDNAGRLLVGVPGYYSWNGGVVLYPDSGGGSALNYKVGQCPSTSSINIWPETRQIPNLKGYNHYLGYAMTSGKYWSAESIFAVGAPRAKLEGGNSFVTGEVKFLRAMPMSNSIFQDYSIFGSQLGSYFGSVLASADINGDGFDELIVGAPYHNLQETSVDSYDEGCAFVYTFRLKNNVIAGDVDRLCPNKEPGGRFGSAIAKLGDINQDSFEDIAISAPIAENGAGRVYIYFGTSQKLSQTPLSFSASQFNSEIRGFGSTLYGNVDLDGNGTPDIIIGSFFSKQAFIFRTRPKLKLDLNFRSNIQKFKRDDEHFNLQYCIRAKRLPNDFNSTLKIYVEVTADADRSDNSVRFKFANGERNLQFLIDVGNRCNNQRPYIRVNLTQNLLATDSKEIKFKWQLRYNATKNLSFNARMFEITETTQGNESDIRGSENFFCPSCPAPFTSKEIFFSIPLANDTCDSDNNPKCTSNLKISGKLYDGNGSVRSKSILGSTEKRILKITVNNSGETAYSPTLNLTIKFTSLEIAKYVIKTLTTDCLQVINEAQNALDDLEYTVSCGSSIPLHTNKTWSISYQMDFGGLNALQKDEEITFQTTAYPAAYLEQSTTKKFKMNLVSKFDLKISGINHDENVLDFNSRDSQQFINSYLVHNDGISPLGSILLEFKIPVKSNFDGNGKYETVIQIAEPKQMGLQCNSTEVFESLVETPLPMEPTIYTGNESIYSISLMKMSRKRRETETQKEDNGNPNVVKEETSLLSMKSNSMRKEIGCGSSEWECATLTCQLTYALSQNNPLVIDLRLKIINHFARQLIKEEIDVIVVKTDAQAKLFDSEIFTKMASSRTDFMIIKDGRLSSSVIFGSVVGGLILLLLVTFGLFKCGFFRRRTMEQLEAMKAREEEQKVLSENFPMLLEDESDE